MPDPKPLHRSFRLSGHPEAWFTRFAALPDAAILESQMPMERIGRYSFACLDPFLTFRSRGRTVQIAEGGDTRTFEADPFEALAELLGAYRTVHLDEVDVPFQGGAVGYFSYDLGREVERLPATALDDLALPDGEFHFYDAILATDRETETGHLFSTGFPAPNETRRLRRAEERLAAWRKRLDGSPPLGEAAAERPLPTGGFACPALASNFTRETYEEAVARTRQYIIDGDVFQVNLSQRFEMPFTAGSAALFDRLRAINPAPFAACLNFPSAAVVSSSPERYLRVAGGTVEIRPIKGTRPRGASPSEDDQLARELLASAKDRAENTMIVDLVRNDLGRVCDFGSVRVEEWAALEAFPTVFHLTSTVRGTLREDRTPLDAVRATFPDGSITGAPKVRAMEIIEELEGLRRGIYTGAVGYLGFSGPLDMNVAIRTVVLARGRAYFGVGGGVVYDSDPAAEYVETLDKGRALARALISLSPQPALDRSTAPGP